MIAELAAAEADPAPRSRHLLKPIAGLFRYVVLRKYISGPVNDLTSALRHTPVCYEDRSVRVYCPEQLQHSSDVTFDRGMDSLGEEIAGDEKLDPGEKLRVKLFW